MLAVATTNANTILNRVAAELGTAPVQDAFSAVDPTFTQLRYLLNAAGEELALFHPWSVLVREHRITTAPGDSGEYPLPADFLYMIDQTGWERANRTPLYGPLSAQEWSYVKGLDHGPSPFHVAFRVQEGNMRVFPQAASGLDIFFEYISKNWVRDVTTSPPLYRDEVQLASDIPLFDRALITRYLKVKFLEAKGFDSTKAQDDFNQVFSFITGKDRGGRVLSLTGGGGIRYLGGRNVPDSGYGSS